MIISDKYRFVFVHIPKCAGTTVRARLEGYDDTMGKYSSRVSQSSSLGYLDYTHLALGILLKISPMDFGKVRDYESYAIIRDPYDRFRSAVSQRLKMYRGTELAQSSDKQIRKEIEKIIQYLEGTRQVTNPEFIHFTKQYDYIFLDREKIVNNLFPISRIDLLLASIGNLTGTKISFPIPKNQTLIFKHPALRPPYLAGKKIAKTIFPQPVSKAIGTIVRKGFMRKLDSRELSVFDSKYLHDFVTDYYSDDFSLWKIACSDTGESHLGFDLRQSPGHLS